jgi:hypothetical protein
MSRDVPDISPSAFHERTAQPSLSNLRPTEDVKVTHHAPPPTSEVFVGSAIRKVRGGLGSRMHATYQVASSTALSSNVLGGKTDVIRERGMF